MFSGDSSSGGTLVYTIQKNRKRNALAGLVALSIVALAGITVAAVYAAPVILALGVVSAILGGLGALVWNKEVYSERKEMAESACTFRKAVNKGLVGGRCPSGKPA